jgi:hypothetical protein
MALSSVTVVSNALRLRRFVTPHMASGSLTTGEPVPVVRPEPS